MTETVRVLTILIAGANVGAIIAFYSAAGRKLVPSSWSRGWLGGDAIVMMSVAWANAAHVHREIPPQLLLLNVGALIQLVGIVGLWRWYRTPDGEERLLGMEARHAVDDIAKRFTKWVIAFSAILLVMWIFGGWYAINTNRSLCTFRSDLEQRVDGTRVFLRLSKDPLIAGVPRAAIQQNLRNQQATLDSLSGLHC